MISPQSIAEHRQTRKPCGRLSAGGFSSAHLVGICGSGMKALAELLSGLGCKVSGSDLAPVNPSVCEMKKRGLRVHFGHQGRFLPRDVDVLVYSSAVGENNPERQLAARLKIPQLSYTQMLGRLMQKRVGISIAGTHGKSTTTAMTAAILTAAKLSPSAVIGAELCGGGLSGFAGEGELFVVESCEYQRSFLDLCPQYAAITGIEPDHFDYYPDFEETKTAFAEFAANVAADGTLFVRGDCPASMQVSRSSSAEIVTFSLRSPSDWWAADFRKKETGLWFRVFHRGEFFTELSLQLPGVHNVMNSLAATAICDRLGVSADEIRQSLRDFRGVCRRFERVGSYRGVTLIDDYAHHPTAVAVTLESAREEFRSRRIWCAFQPHQVSRTQALMQQFAESFCLADQVLIAPIFAARENLSQDREAVAEKLASRIAASGRPARFCASLDQIITTLEDEARPGDVLITMGAGDIDRVHHEFTRRLRRNQQTR